jgi:hypothetical protein
MTSKTDDEALGQIARRAGRRRIAAQVTLFDAVNKSVLDELREVNVESLAPEEARRRYRACANASSENRFDRTF